MSRIGKKPISVPAGVEIGVSGRTVSVKGPKGQELKIEHRPEVGIEYSAGGKELTVTRRSDDGPSKAYHGLTRALIQNMINGVTKGYEKKLEIHGVGYLAAVQGKVLQLRVGFANEIHMEIPQGLTVTAGQEQAAPPATGQAWVVTVKGIDKQAVGDFAARVRAARKAEPYKGKGVRYRGEHVRRKAGKANTK